MDTSRDGSVDALRKLTIWYKAQAIPGFSSAIWRHDRHGRPMRFSDFGDAGSRFGWNIQPAKGGGRSPGDCHAVHCGRGYLVADRAVSASHSELVESGDSDASDFDRAFRAALAAE